MAGTWNRTPLCCSRQMSPVMAHWDTKHTSIYSSVLFVCHLCMIWDSHHHSNGPTTFKKKLNSHPNIWLSVSSSKEIITKMKEWRNISDSSLYPYTANPVDYCCISTKGQPFCNASHNSTNAVFIWELLPIYDSLLGILDTMKHAVCNTGGWQKKYHKEEKISQKSCTFTNSDIS